MKKGFWVIAFLIFTVAGVSAQCNEAVSALKASDADGLSRHFANTVELTIGDKEVMYGKEQAKRMVADFFVKNNPAVYETRHKNEGSPNKYIIGTYKGKTGTYRVYVSFHSEGGREVIRTLKFENE
jgi:hypothetical protein